MLISYRSIENILLKIMFLNLGKKCRKGKVNIFGSSLKKKRIIFWYVKFKQKFDVQDDRNISPYLITYVIITKNDKILFFSKNLFTNIILFSVIFKR